MKVQNFKEISAILSKRRQDAKQNLTIRQNEIYNQIPEIHELKKELSTTTVKLIKVILSGSKNKKEAIDKIRDNNIQTQQIIKELLISNGYDPSYLDIEYTCNECEDTGFIKGNKCECVNKLEKEIACKNLNKLSQLKVNNFNTFRLDYYTSYDEQEKMKKILNYCKKYSETFTYNSSSILMMGQTGLGKTHLSLSIANEAINKGFNVIYGSAQDIFRNIEKEHFGRETEYKNILDSIIECELLILDDLGAEFDSNFYTSVLYNIINSRMNKNIPTIISTNLNKNELETKYNPKITSRLLNFKILGFIGKDIRQIKNINELNNF